MRVAVLCGGSYVSGTEIVALTVVRGLRERGHDVRVLANAFTNGDFPGRLAAAGIPHERVHVGKVSLALRSPYLRWTATALARLPGALLAARRWFREFDPEVVIANNRDTVVLLDPLLRGRALVFHMHEAPPASRSTRFLYGRVAARTTTFLAVSEHVRSRLVAIGVDDSRTAVVYNGVEVTDAMGGGKRAPDAPFTVGIVGQIGDWKGHDDLFAALALLQTRGVAFRCIVVGDGDAAYVARLRESADAGGIAHSVTWRGYVPNVRAVYPEFDVCVVPSRFEEPFGMVAVEAGLAGVPVIATRRGGLPEVVDDGVTGFLVAPENPPELAERLLQLAADGALRERLGAAARARVRARFTADRMVREIEAHCRRAMDGART